ncbi:hypothetical protein E2542_SST23466 [Spatholobus suberectus]|nr:hypothetical protein E2542_SST23466 [Spatholobus suberectus]
MEDGGWGRSAAESTSLELKLETMAVIDGKDWELVGADLHGTGRHEGVSRHEMAEVGLPLTTYKGQLIYFSCLAGCGGHFLMSNCYYLENIFPSFSVGKEKPLHVFCSSGEPITSYDRFEILED